MKALLIMTVVICSVYRGINREFNFNILIWGIAFISIANRKIAELSVAG